MLAVWSGGMRWTTKGALVLRGLPRGLSEPGTALKLLQKCLEPEQRYWTGGGGVSEPPLC